MIGSYSFSEFENVCERGKVLANQFCFEVPTRMRWSCGLALPVDPQPPEDSSRTQIHIWVHTHTSPKDTRKCLWTVQTNYRFKIRAIFLKPIIEILPLTHNAGSSLPFSSHPLAFRFMYKKHSMHKKWASITGASWTAEPSVSYSTSGYKISFLPLCYSFVSVNPLLIDACRLKLP